VVIGDGVTAIYSETFKGCDNLTSVTIGKSVSCSESGAFDGCTRLSSVYITDLSSWCNIKFTGVNSNPLSYANNLYLNDELITELVIPEGVTSISSFINCTNIISVVIPDSVTNMGRFSGCHNLTSVTIGNGVTSIGDWAFHDCRSLINIVIPDSVIAIGYSAFASCTSLSSVIIPKSVTSVKNYAFLYCTNLTSVYYKGTETEWNTITIAGDSFPDNATIYYYSETQPTTYGNYWHYVNGVPTVWEIAISTYALDVKFARTAYIDPGSGLTTVGDVGDFNVTIPTEISNIETLEIPVWATQAKSGYLKLSLGSYTNANCTLVLTDSANGEYTLTISEATGDVSVTINGTSP
jgi:hypothetical protein